MKKFIYFFLFLFGLHFYSGAQVYNKPGYNKPSDNQPVYNQTELNQQPSHVLSDNKQDDNKPPDYIQYEQLFHKHPVLNSQVENFIDHFIMNLFSDELSNYSIYFDKESDFSKGFLKASFNGLMHFTEQPYSSFFGDFSFFIDPHQGKLEEYGLNFKLNANIQPLESALAVINDKLSFCFNPTSQEQYFKSLCEATQNYKWDETLTRVENLSQALYLWKSLFINQLKHIKDPDLQGYEAQLAHFIEQHILIQEGLNTVSLKMDFSNLKQEFSGKIMPFLKKTKLVDLSLESLTLDFTEHSVFISLHVKKLHVANHINLYVELLSQLQSFMEDSERAINLGQSLREDLKNRELNKLNLLKQLSLREGAALSMTLGSALINNNENKDLVVSTQIEEDLGLE